MTTTGDDPPPPPVTGTDLHCASPYYLAEFNLLFGARPSNRLPADDGSGDVFVHQTRIHKDGFRSLAEGEPLEFKGKPTPANASLAHSAECPPSRLTTGMRRFVLTRRSLRYNIEGS